MVNKFTSCWRGGINSFGIASVVATAGLSSSVSATEVDADECLFILSIFLVVSLTTVVAPCLAPVTVLPSTSVRRATQQSIGSI
jgi:hypothetical protein